MSADTRGPARNWQVVTLRDAWVPDRRPTPDIQRVSLTTLRVSERCHGCPWPRVCGTDETCWRLEREQPWKRSVLAVNDE